MSLRTAQDKVRTRDGHYCVRCGSSILNTPSSIHHRKPRGMGGTNNPLSYDLPLCRNADPRRVESRRVSGCETTYAGFTRLCGRPSTMRHLSCRKCRTKLHAELCAKHQSPTCGHCGTSSWEETP